MKHTDDAVRRPTPGSAAGRAPAAACEASAGAQGQRASFTDLPPEIHLLISRQLIYPDALSLKHTSSYFYYLVDTGVRLKVEWLMERRMLHLECPNDKRCDLGSDLRFCRGSVPCVIPMLPTLVASHRIIDPHHADFSCSDDGNTWSASRGRASAASSTAPPSAPTGGNSVPGASAGCGAD